MTTATANNTVLAWHTLPANKKTTNGEGIEVTPGQTLRLPDGVKPDLCKRGYHASVKALDLLKNYVAGPIWCRVELGGTIVYGDTKCVASERTCIAMVDGTKVLQRFAIWCAEQALNAIDQDKVDTRSREALRVAALYIDGKATAKEISDASYAASYASYASDASYVASHAAADASHASHAACYASHASHASYAAPNEKLEAMLLEAMNIRE